jgi:hypothetical protein
MPNRAFFTGAWRKRPLFATSGALVSVVLLGTLGRTRMHHAKGSGNVRPTTATSSLAARIRSCFGSLPAPLISKTMRSRKLVPVPDVICITDWPEATSVPAETQLRTPCASQITGADSPVIADSSIAARPWMTSPSPGTICLTSTATRLPGFTPSVGRGPFKP